MKYTRLIFITSILFAGVVSAMDRPAVIVPVDKPITIDGNDQEWENIQAQQTIFQGGKPVTQFKLAADDKAFYAYVQVIDDSPLLNTTKILEELIKGGDAVGFSFLYGKRADAHQRIVAARVEGRDVVIAMRPRWRAKDNPVWEVVQWDGGQGAGIFQLPISGPVRLTCTLTGEPVPDFYNLPGVAALFFDPLEEGPGR